MYQNKMAAPSTMPVGFSSLHELSKKTAINDEDIKKILENVRNLKEIFQKQSLRREACDADLNVLKNTLLSATNFASVDDRLDVITELMGLLRNMCADCRINQELVGKSDLFDVAFSCLEKQILQEDNNGTDNSHHQKRLKCLRIGVQFLGNLVVNNQANKELVWKSLRIHFGHLLQSEDSTLAQYSTMVLYNCTASMPHIVNHLLNDIDYGIAICKSVLQMLLEKESDWSLYFIELMLKNESFLRRVFCNLPEEHRSLTLDILEECLLQSTPSSPDVEIAPDNITFLSEHLKKQSDGILQTSQEYVTKSLNPVEVVKTLSVLCSASAMDNYRRILQSDSSLLVVIIHLLKGIHMIGKSGDNTFTPVEKLSEAVNPSSSISENPGYGLKRDLVRLIGNMCWEHKQNQDMVRELDGISLLLDCSKMDARNPFITQWVVFAIHNLCDGNSENQAIIASMQPVGIEESSVLKDCELSTEIQNSQPRKVEEMDESGPSHTTTEASPSVVHSSKNTSTARERAITDIQDLFL